MQDGKLLSKRQRQQNKQTTKMTTKNKQTNKTKQKQKHQNKQLNEWSSDVVIIIDLRQTERGRKLKRVLLRLYPKQILAEFYRFTSGRFGAKYRGL